jgi:hypothetical protein
MKWIFSIFFCGLMVGCSLDNRNAYPMNHQTVNPSELKTAILFRGDTGAYESLKIEFLDYAFPQEFSP